MKKKLFEWVKKPFVRNVAVVATGTASAQAITILFAPLVTRIYGPEAFGVLGIFIAIISIIGPIAAMSYPIAIVLPKSDTEAKGIVRLSLSLSFSIAVVVTLLVFIFEKPIGNILKMNDFIQFLYLIPLLILFSAFLQIAEQWVIRKKQFHVAAKAALLKAIIINGAKVGVGWINPTAWVLVILTALGHALHSLLLLFGTRRKSKNDPERRVDAAFSLPRIAAKYKDFPMFRAPQILINASSQSLPVLLLTGFFGPAAAGYYTLGRSVLGMPTQLIGKSVKDVFYPRVVEAVERGENPAVLIKKASVALAVVGIIPFGLVIFFGPWLFTLVFGAEWTIAGQYARWLALWTYFSLLHQPSVSAIPVLNLQGQFLLYEIASVALRTGALVTGYIFLGDDLYSVALFSIAGVILSTSLVIYTIWRAGVVFVRTDYRREIG